MWLQGSNRRVAELDGWRGISIAMVVIGHLLNSRYSLHSALFVPKIARELSVWGVDVFFVVSGFIITSLAVRERHNTGRFAVIGFYTRRFFRIVPPLLVFLATLMLANVYGYINQPYSATLNAATFRCNFPDVPCGWFAGHTWTLAYEEQFYLIFPLIFVPLARSASKLFAGLLLFLISFPIARFALHLGSPWDAYARLTPSFSFICAGAVAAVNLDRIIFVAESRWSNYVSGLVAAMLVAILFVSSTFAFPLGTELAYFQVLANNTVLPIGHLDGR